MARTLFPHHRHINFDPALYTALNQVAQWRRCSLAAYVRDAVEVMARAEYANRGVAFPPDYIEVIPGQTSMFPPVPPAVETPVPFQPEGPMEPAPSQGILGPEGKAAVRSFLSLGHGIVVGGPVAAPVEPAVEVPDAT
jgi:hypothetical protein